MVDRSRSRASLALCEHVVAEGVTFFDALRELDNAAKQLMAGELDAADRDALLSRCEHHRARIHSLGLSLEVEITHRVVVSDAAELKRRIPALSGEVLSDADYIA